MEMEDAKLKMHQAYLLCKEIFEPQKTFVNNRVQFDSEEELFFCHMVNEFFLQQKQKEIIRR